MTEPRYVLDHVGIECPALLDQGRELGARNREEGDVRVRRAYRSLVGAARDRGRRGQQADAPVRARAHRLPRGGRDDPDHSDAGRLRDAWEAGGGR